MDKSIATASSDRPDVAIVMKVIPPRTFGRMPSPRLARNIGYAMVPTGLSALGTKLAIETPWGETAAVVAEKPFFKASN